MSIALRQNWRTAPSRPALRQLLRVDRLEQPSGRLSQPEVRMSMCPVLGTLVPSGIHRTCRIVAGLAVLSVLASKIQTWSHMASASRARVETVQDRPESWFS
jgi:hypothetical protein